MRTCLFMLVVLSLASIAFSASPILTKFSASSDQVRLSPNDLANAPKKITVNVPAIIFRPPILIENLQDNKKYPYEEISFFRDYLRSYYYGTHEQILSYWAPEDRPRIVKLLNDKEFFEIDRKLYHKKPKIKKILGIIYQKGTVSVLYSVLEKYKDINVLVSSVTIKKNNGRYFLTDHPSDDFQLSVVESSLSHWKGKR